MAAGGFVCKIDEYRSLFILPLILPKGVTPFLVMHPHTIILSPPCFTAVLTLCLVMTLGFFDQNQERTSDSNLMIFVSSDQTTYNSKH